MSVITAPHLQAASSTMYIHKALLYSPSESDCMASPGSDDKASPDSIFTPLSSTSPTSPPHVCYSICPTSKSSGDSSASLVLKRHVVEGQTQMHNRFCHYNCWVSPQCFAARSIGHSLFTSLGLEVVILVRERKVHPQPLPDV
ncbi:hypothetical protein PAXRUDRAFT_20007 [Paxillus rubicundulus Ve08.2h10]|uniref:Uncharacterized protein n=1 Tax=Paxillus rubicundulus Ve08.2h10 TaxID=930991 RepID=A0A0D0DAS5_9AGAM|nr:hypothetical protein PAXRUDRAFT_20007 [Paxillus rubicundulus Ve08.2h10]